jgi:hypothetical protein
MRTLFLTLVAVVGLGVTAHAQDSAAVAKKPPRRDPSVISAEEIAQAPQSIRDAYELVKMLRPRFFERHSVSRIGQNPIWGEGPGVVFDDTPRGGIDNLRNIPLTSIREIRYLNGPDASNRYGSDFHAGAIVVTGR